MTKERAARIQRREKVRAKALAKEARAPAKESKEARVVERESTKVVAIKSGTMKAVELAGDAANKSLPRKKSI